jgi:hypothetical protein
MKYLIILIKKQKPVKINVLTGFSCSGDSMEFDVMNCIEMHSIAHNSTYRTSQPRYRFQQYCKIEQNGAIQYNVCSSRVPVVPFLIVLKHD